MVTNVHADDVIDHIALKYGNCQTYQDIGRVDGAQGAITFSTYFVRPNKFRFDWIYLDRASIRNSVWSDGLKVFAHHALVEAPEELPNLSLAIAGATGVSQGTAHTVSTLLIPGAEVARTSRTLLKLVPYELCESEIVAGELCHRVTSTRTNGRNDLWIRASDYAILMYREESTSTPADDEQTIAAVYEIDAGEAEEMRQYLSMQTEEDRHSATCARYERVAFDEPIDEAVFTGAGCS